MASAPGNTHLRVAADIVKVPSTLDPIGAAIEACDRAERARVAAARCGAVHRGG